MPSAAFRPRVSRHAALTVLKLAVSVALLAVLFARIDVATIWAGARRAAPAWLAAALAAYFTNVVMSAWRWRVLLDAQQVRVPQGALLASYLVAGFFNNFLPSNIGGDVIRIRDTAGPAGSKTLATMVVLADRGIGLLGLVLVAAVGATMAAPGPHGSPIPPVWLWAGFAAGAGIAGPAIFAPRGVAQLVSPLSTLGSGWIAERVDLLLAALGRFRERPGALLACFGGAVVVQALLVLFYLAVVRALRLPVGVWDLSVIVPVSFLVQMLPVSMNGFGVREAAFSLYFAAIGLPLESALLLPLVATALVIAFSLSGAVVYVTRRSHAQARPLTT